MVFQAGLCHEASAQPVAQPSRPSASRAIDNSLSTASGSFRSNLSWVDNYRWTDNGQRTIILLNTLIPLTARNAHGKSEAVVFHNKNKCGLLSRAAKRNGKNK